MVLGVMVIKEYSTLFRSPGPDLNNWIQLSLETVSDKEGFLSEFVP